MSDLSTNQTEWSESTEGPIAGLVRELHAGRDKDGGKKQGDGNDVSPEPAEPSKWDDPVPAAPTE